MLMEKWSNYLGVWKHESRWIKYQTCWRVWEAPCYDWRRRVAWRAPDGAIICTHAASSTQRRRGIPPRWVLHECFSGGRAHPRRCSMNKLMSSFQNVLPKPYVRNLTTIPAVRGRDFHRESNISSLAEHNSESESAIISWVAGAFTLLPRRLFGNSKWSEVDLIAPH